MSIDMPLSVLLDEIQEMMVTRHRKYGRKNVSDAPGGPINAVRVRLYDKLCRINHAVDSDGQHEFDDDSFRDAFIDVVGYGLIGLLVLDGEWPGAVEKPLEDYLPPATPIRPDWRETPAVSRTHRWAELGESGKPKTELDGWRVGTTFEPDNFGLVRCWAWVRTRDGWSPQNIPTIQHPSLAAVVDAMQYSDGTITEPDTNLEAAA